MAFCSFSGDLGELTKQAHVMHTSSNIYEWIYFLLTEMKNDIQDVS